MTGRMTPVGAGTAVALGMLATYRVTRLITEDTITEPIREHIWDKHGDPSTAPRISLSYLVSCPHCASVYAGAAVTAMALPNLPFARARHMALVALALSGAVSAYHEIKEMRGGSTGW